MSIDERLNGKYRTMIYGSIENFYVRKMIFQFHGRHALIMTYYNRMRSLFLVYAS